MGILGAIGTGIGLLGAAGSAQKNRKLEKKLMAALNAKQTPLEIPAAFKDLMARINDQYLQAGDAQSHQIRQTFGQNLAHVLGQLQMRGLSSGNLTANLSAGNTKRQEEAVANARFGLLGQQLGSQQNIGLAGLSGVQQERNAQLSQRGSILGGIAGPILTGPGPMDALAKGIGLLSTLAPI